MLAAMKILLVDDHVLIRQATRALIERLVPRAGIVEAASREQTLLRLREPPLPDWVLMDLGLPDNRDLALFHLLRRECPGARVAILSAQEDPDLARAAMDAGAAGFIPKSSQAEQLESALRVMFSGGSYLPPMLAQAPSDQDLLQALTPRQRDVLGCLRQGHGNKDIARILGLSEPTVKTHLAAVFRALRVRNRVEAVVLLQKAD